MTPDRYRPVDTDEVLRRVDTHARVGAALLGGLGEVGHGEEALDAFTAAVDSAAATELADVAHDLARTCLRAHSKFARGVAWIVDPKEAADLHRAIRVLHDRVHPGAALPDLPSPGTESDIRPLVAALELCKTIEGDSDRVRFTEAELPGIHDQWDEVALRAKQLAKSTTSWEWERSANLLHAHALIQLRQGADAQALLHETALRFGTDRITLANMACACALEHDQRGFDEAAARFARLEADATDLRAWSPWLIENASWFSSQLDRDARNIASAFGLEHAL